MSWESIIHLHKNQFSELEKPLAEIGSLKASTFVYPSGVQAIRLQNELGQMIVLPFQGQQIWSLEFHGRNLTMKTMFNTPYNAPYLQTYGGFLIHCGAMAMGVPGPDDTHPLHGELPNAPYQTAQLLIGEDVRGRFMTITGTYQHTVAFAHNYLAKPCVKFYENSSQINVHFELENLKNSSMDFMYMAHVNFRPIDNGKLKYSAKVSSDTVRVRSSIPSHVKPPPGYAEFLEQLSANPSLHHKLEPGMGFDPEVVFFIDYLADQNGWAHSLQVHPSGVADYIAHKPSQLGHGVRWISRTPDQDCLGIVLPATAEPEGFSAERSKGNIKTLEAHGKFSFSLEIGALLETETKEIEAKIAALISS
jgi:Domain of unknown function (DUF4432)